MSKRADERKALVSARVMREQEWAYDLRAAHHSVREISMLSYRGREQGGLGYGLSSQAVKGLVNSYLERMRESLEESPAERIAQEVADLDMQYRAAARLVAATYIDEVGDEQRRDERTILAALATLRQIGERRAKLLGLDATEKKQVDVTVRDAASAELEAMLAEAGIRGA